MVVSIHQPNFFPWYPYFQKIKKCEIFVLLTECQFQRSECQNRFHNKEKTKWYTMSVHQAFESITIKRYVTPEKDWNRIKNQLPNYKKALSIFDDCISSSLMKTNISIIYRISEILKISTTIVVDYPTSLLSTERLVDICKTHNANKYIAGMSGRNYLDLSLFEKEKIEVEFQIIKDEDRKPIIEVLMDYV